MSDFQPVPRAALFIPIPNLLASGDDPLPSNWERRGVRPKPALELFDGRIAVPVEEFRGGTLSRTVAVEPGATYAAEVWLKGHRRGALEFGLVDPNGGGGTVRTVSVDGSWRLFRVRTRAYGPTLRLEIVHRSAPGGPEVPFDVALAAPHLGPAEPSVPVPVLTDGTIEEVASRCPHAVNDTPNARLVLFSNR